jgi:hypothetical protein
MHGEILQWTYGLVQVAKNIPVYASYFSSLNSKMNDVLN